LKLENNSYGPYPFLSIFKSAGIIELYGQKYFTSMEMNNENQKFLEEPVKLKICKELFVYIATYLSSYSVN